MEETLHCLKSPLIPLTDRISSLQKLELCLQQFANRIENSIKHRWWFWILHLFGYQAKCPENIKAVLNTTKDTLKQLEKQSPSTPHKTANPASTNDSSTKPDHSSHAKGNEEKSGASKPLQPTGLLDPQSTTPKKELENNTSGLHGSNKAPAKDIAGPAAEEGKIFYNPKLFVECSSISFAEVNINDSLTFIPIEEINASTFAEALSNLKNGKQVKAWQSYKGTPKEALIKIIFSSSYEEIKIEGKISKESIIKAILEHPLNTIDKREFLQYLTPPQCTGETPHIFYLSEKEMYAILQMAQKDNLQLNLAATNTSGETVFRKWFDDNNLKLIELLIQTDPSVLNQREGDLTYYTQALLDNREKEASFILAGLKKMMPLPLEVVWAERAYSNDHSFAIGEFKSLDKDTQEIILEIAKIYNRQEFLNRSNSPD